MARGPVSVDRSDVSPARCTGESGRVCLQPKEANGKGRGQHSTEELEGFLLYYYSRVC